MTTGFWPSVGLRIYFDKNSLADDALSRLSVGGEMRYVVHEKEGELGLSTRTGGADDWTSLSRRDNGMTRDMVIEGTKAAVRYPAGRRAVVAWCLFDWANSAFPTVIQIFLFGAYFTTAVAPNAEIGTAEWGRANTVAAVSIALISPILGAIADQGGRRKPWLLALNLICIAAMAALWFVRPDPADAMFGLIAMVIGTLGFELGTTFYNAMLADVVHPDYLGRVSGWGWGRRLRRPPGLPAAELVPVRLAATGPLRS